MYEFKNLQEHDDGSEIAKGRNSETVCLETLSLHPNVSSFYVDGSLQSGVCSSKFTNDIIK